MTSANSYEFVVVGFRFRNSKASDLNTDSQLLLEPETDNKYDQNAIKLLIKNEDGEPKHIGYIARDYNKEIAEVLKTCNNRYKIDVDRIFAHSAVLELTVMDD